MINKPLLEIGIDDIQYLINNKIEESRTLEYKNELDGGKYGNSEFLADFVAFANSIGGDLIIGIMEGKGSEKGKPVSISGVFIKNTDEDRLALNNTVRDRISPRFMDFKSHYIKIHDDKYVIIIRIKQSWNKPHMISNASRDFFIRNTSGKHAMDITEIKSSIFTNRAGKEQLTEFKNNRLLSIMSNTINNTDLGEAPRIVAHVIPLVSFSEAPPSIPISTMEACYYKYEYAGHSNFRLNFDGDFALIDEGKVYSYIQFFRNGIVEFAKAVYTDEVRNGFNTLIKVFSIQSFNEILDRIKNFLQYLSENDIETPICVSISLVGFKGVGIGLSFPVTRSTGLTLDRDFMALPDVMVIDYNIKFMDLMNDNLAILSNAFGMTDIGLK